ncbi:MAG: CPBP family intramembrane metalloprotease [Caldilinea sp. CFX5]|nr:CPBP family intramembrane metalloprotease [Caldilinea sp. CFX5]
MTAHTTVRPAAATHHEQRSTLSRLVARHPVTAYLVLAFTFAWATLVPLLLSQQGFGVLPIELPVKLFNALASFVGLALPAFLVTAAIGGRAGVQDLLQRSLRWQVGIQWYLIALLGLFVAVIVAALPFVGLVPLAMVAQKWMLLFTVFLPGVVVPFLSINLPEEVAWTGFLQAQWQTRHGPLWASIMVAPFFALIHLPAYFVAGWMSDEPIPLTQFPTLLLQIGLTAVFAIFFRLLIMWLYNGTGGSVLIVGLFHSAFNMITGQQITPFFIPGPTASWLNLFVVLVTMVVAVLITIVTKGRLAYKSAPV